MSLVEDALSHESYALAILRRAKQPAPGAGAAPGASGDARATRARWSEETLAREARGRRARRFSGHSGARPLPSRSQARMQGAHTLGPHRHARQL